MRLKTLNGAPLRENLDFSPHNLLGPSGWDVSFRDFLDARTAHSCITESGESMGVRWRHLEPTPTRLRTGWSQPYLPRGGISEVGTSFSHSALNLEHSTNETNLNLHHQDMTTHTLEDCPTQTQDFLQHSLVLHDTLLSSQLALDAYQKIPTRRDRSISSSFHSISFDTTTTDASQTGEDDSEVAIFQLPAYLAITPLNSLPTASHIRSIYPQTPTPTLLCVLTAEAEQREVVVRKGNSKMHLYELTVADETGSNFKVSFWFRPGRTQDQAQESLRHTIEGVEVGDVLLLRHIVLTTFREVVYGQSLSPRITKARTTVEILFKADGSGGFKHISPAAVEEKFVRLKKWAESHVVSAFGNMRKRKGHVESPPTSSKRSTYRWNGDALPPDTMEST